MHPELKDHAESVRGEEMRAAHGTRTGTVRAQQRVTELAKANKALRGVWMRLPRYPNWMTSLDK
jgi:hypothetical protein